MCITGHALLSALVKRLRSGGALTSERELRALFGSGCSLPDLERAFAQDGPGMGEARATLERLRRPAR